MKKYNAKKIKDDFEYHSHTNTHYLTEREMQTLLKGIEEHA